MISASVRHLEFWGVLRGCRNARALRGQVAVGGLLVGCSWLQFGKYSYTKNNQEEEIIYPDGEGQIFPKEHYPNQQEAV